MSLIQLPRGLLFYKYCMQEMAHMLTMPSKIPQNAEF
jgi:hypothetical protein